MDLLGHDLIGPAGVPVVRLVETAPVVRPLVDTAGIAAVAGRARVRLPVRLVRTAPAVRLIKTAPAAGPLVDTAAIAAVVAAVAGRARVRLVRVRADG